MIQIVRTHHEIPKWVRSLERKKEEWSREHSVIAVYYNSLKVVLAEVQFFRWKIKPFFPVRDLKFWRLTFFKNISPEANISISGNNSKDWRQSGLKFKLLNLEYLTSTFSGERSEKNQCFSLFPYVPLEWSLKIPFKIFCIKSS